MASFRVFFYDSLKILRGILSLSQHIFSQLSMNNISREFFCFLRDYRLKQPGILKHIYLHGSKVQNDHSERRTKSNQWNSNDLLFHHVSRKKKCLNFTWISLAVIFSWASSLVFIARPRSTSCTCTRRLFQAF